MAAAAKGSPPRNRRRIRNYLLDRGFQLKYAGYLVLVAAVLSVSLGVLLWRTSQSLVAQSNQAVQQAEQVVKLGHQVAAESKKVSEVVKMNIVKDPIYADNPELLEAFMTDANKQDQTIKGQQAALQKQAAALEQQSTDIAARQRTLLWTLILVLLGLVVGVGLAGIVVTHKIAGPVYKMSRQIRTVAGGSWALPGPLRKGDELTGFFEEFEGMVRSLREQRDEELELLDAAMAKIEPAAPKGAAVLEDLRSRMSRVLES